MEESDMTTQQHSAATGSGAMPQKLDELLSFRYRVLIAVAITLCLIAITLASMYT